MKKFTNDSWTIGAPIVSPLVLEPDNLGYGNGGHCSFKGLVGEILFNEIIRQMRRRGFGCFMIEDRNLGTLDNITNSYNGLLGHLQNGTVDMVAMPSNFPIEDPKNSFTYTYAFHEDTMTICSSYRKNSNETAGDLYSMFTMVPNELWIVYFVSFFTFILITSIGAKVLRKPYSSLWMTICAFLDQDNYPTAESLFIRVLSPIVMVGMFFMMTYAGNCMGTDLVTIDDPITITSYDDIIERNITVALAGNTPEYKLFKNAPEGSKEKIMFRNHKSVTPSPEASILVADKIDSQELVAVARHCSVLTAAYFILGSLAEPGDEMMDDLRAFVGSDEDAMKFANVFVVSAQIIGTPKYRSLNRIVQLVAEHGHYERLMEDIATLICAHIPGYESIASSPSLLGKVSSKIDTAESEVGDIRWIHFFNVFMLPFHGAVIALLALIVEIYLFRSSFKLENVTITQITNNKVTKRRSIPIRKFGIYNKLNSMMKIQAKN